MDGPTQPRAYSHNDPSQCPKTTTPELSLARQRLALSFGDYRDPNKHERGPLRVFNDDVVQGGGGFRMHPHRDMEIITYSSAASWRPL